MHQCHSTAHQFRSNCSPLDWARTDLVHWSRFACTNDFPLSISWSNTKP